MVSVQKLFKMGTVKFLYQKSGWRNILRTVEGTPVCHGHGPNGPYLTVQERCGKIRSFSERKILMPN